MQSNKLKKRHHIIPEVYLKQWKSLDQPKRIIIFCLDKKRLQGQGNSPKNILVENHYFTEQELNGLRSHPTEDYLGERIENRLNRLIKIFESNQIITEEIRIETWSFVLSMFTRVSRWKKLLQDLIPLSLNQGKHQVIDKVIQELVEGKNRASRRKINSRTYRTKLSRDIEQKASSILSPLENSLNTKLHPALVMASLKLKDLQEYPFKIVKTEGIPLLSSDAPCFIDEDPLILSFSEQEITNRAFICPLTPKLAFIGGLGLSIGYTTADSEWVQRFNAKVRANSKEKLIANTNAVNDSWFLENPTSPPTMAEIISQLEFNSSKSEKKGFGKMRN